MAAQISHIFQLPTALRGFHVYKNTENWAPYRGERIIFQQERNNPHDRFAVGGQASFPGRPRPVTVGHVPREISRHAWYAIEHGAYLRPK